MSQPNQILKFLGATAVAVSGFSSSSWACTKAVLVPKEVPASFTVVVRDRGVPLPGVKVALAGEPHVEPRVTDSNGYARFERLSEGYYDVHLDVENGSDERIHIDPSIQDAKYAIWLKWPNLNVITSSRAAGVIRKPCESISDDCLLSTNLTLIAGSTSQEVKTLVVHGSFNFGDVADGIYFLRVKPDQQDKFGMRPEGDIAIEIDHNSVANSLDLDAGMTSCGLYYSGNCPNPEISAYGLCGQSTTVFRMPSGTRRFD